MFRVKVLALLCGLLLFVGCHPAPPNLDPETTKIWQADQAQVILGELQHTAIKFNEVKTCDAAGANCKPLLSDHNTGIVIDGVTVALKTVHVSPQGWQATATTALQSIADALDANGKVTLAAYIDAARSALNLIVNRPQQ